MESWIWLLAIVVLLGVIVVPVLWRSMHPRAATPPAPVSPQQREAAYAEIDMLVAGDSKIAAIKRLREIQPMSLGEAKTQIDRWEPRVTGRQERAPLITDTTPGSPATLPPDAHARIDALVRSGQTIAAIKVYREHTGRGLKESKEAIEAWR